MKRIIVLLCVIVGLSDLLLAQTSNLRYVDARTLNLIGKIAATPQLYHRVDTSRYRDFTPNQNILVTEAAGLALCFKTNSSRISMHTYFHSMGNGANMTGINQYGYDLYIKKNKEWLYAASKAKYEKDNLLSLISNMDTSQKECLLYLPAFSVIDSIKIGIDEQADIESLPNPFRHRIIIFGSSFTHGTSANRSGMSYPLMVERDTGLYIMNLGVSGNSKLQQSFARVLADADADAFIFDAFSNPSAKEIEERFDSFVKTIRESHPTTPLIFMQTIYREERNFDKRADRYEQDKMDMAEKVVKEAMKRDKNIYFINPKNYTGDDHVTSTDGIHPSALGYYRWAKTIEPLLLTILKKYRIE